MIQQLYDSRFIIVEVTGNMESTKDIMVNCPLFNKKIAEGLCWDISNVGNDSLKLPNDKIPPCGWDEAYKVCKNCPEYLAMSE